MGTLITRSSCKFFLYCIYHGLYRTIDNAKETLCKHITCQSRIKVKIEGIRKLIDVDFQYLFRIRYKKFNSWEMGSSTQFIVDCLVDVTPVQWKRGLTKRQIKNLQSQYSLDTQLNLMVWMLALRNNLSYTSQYNSMKPYYCVLELIDIINREKNHWSPSNSSDVSCSKLS